jgi:hypothetical protein
MGVKRGEVRRMIIKKVGAKRKSFRRMGMFKMKQSKKMGVVRMRGIKKLGVSRRLVNKVPHMQRL